MIPSAPCIPFTTPERLPCDLSSDPDANVAEIAILAASFVLWSLGGRRHGACAVTVRPCSPRCTSGGLWHEFGSGYAPVLYEGEWYNVCGCGASTDCSCGPLSEIVLPMSPVVAVSGVILDGVELEQGTDYRVDGRRLVRLGGESWPTCQNMAVAPDAPGAFAVVFSWGVPVDYLGEVAAGELACEIAKAMTNDSSCRLPQRASSVSRQGVTITMLDPQEFLSEGRTGLYLADLWLAAVNPHGLSRESGVWSPDVPAPRFVG